jgi:hypothetical protein
VRFDGGADDVIHPELSVVVGALQIMIDVELPPPERKMQAKKSTMPTIQIRYRCGCFNSRTVEGEFRIGPDELSRALSNVIIVP